MENATQTFNRGDRVIEPHYYGIGTVRYLDGDLMPDGSGRYYEWPSQVCVEFDREIVGEKPFMWCQIDKLRMAAPAQAYRHSWNGKHWFYYHGDCIQNPTPEPGVTFEPIALDAVPVRVECDECYRVIREEQ